MSILAEPRRKQRISVDPRNLHWKNDANGIGKKMLEQMGWKDGHGIGRQQQGRAENLKLKPNYAGKGLGCEHSYDDTWITRHDDFANLLASLNKNKHNTSDDVPVSQQNTSNATAVEKSKRSRLRIRYRRFTRGEDLSEYSEEDKCAVLGTRKRSHREQENSSVDSAPSDFKSPPPKMDEGNTIQSSLTMNEYFAEKMRQLNEKKLSKK